MPGSPSLSSPLLPQTNDPLEIKKSLLDLSGKTASALQAFQQSVISVTSDLDLGTKQYSIILVTTGSKTVNIKLPYSAKCSIPEIRIIKIDSGSGQVNVYPRGNDNLMGASSPITFAYQWQALDLFPDGSISWNDLRYLFSPSQFSPLPQLLAGAGQVLYRQSNGGPILTPAGGTWWVLFASYFSNASGGWAGQYTGSPILAGGTQILAAVAGDTALGSIYEILDAHGFDSSRPIYKRDDGSFVITAETGHPYHVLTHEQARAQGTQHDALYDKVRSFIESHPELLQAEPQPDSVKVDPEMQLHSEIMADLVDQAKKLPKWQTRIAQLRGE